MRCTTLSFNPPHSHARCTTLHTFAHTFVALFPLCSWALMLCWYSSNLFLFFSYTLISLTDVRNAVGWMLGLGREPECRSRPFLYLFLFGYSRRAGSVRILVIRVWKHWNCGDIWNSILRVKPFRPSLFFPSRHWHYQLLLRGFIFFPLIPFTPIWWWCSALVCSLFFLSVPVSCLLLGATFSPAKLSLWSGARDFAPQKNGTAE